MMYIVILISIFNNIYEDNNMISHMYCFLQFCLKQM
jgi:hypothetical protein